MYEAGWRLVETPPLANCPKQINKSKQKKLEEGFCGGTDNQRNRSFISFFFFSFQTNTRGLESSRLSSKKVSQAARPMRPPSR